MNAKRDADESVGPSELTALERTVIDSDSALANRLESPVLRIGALTRKLIASKPARVVQHYLNGDGNLLAAGMSFQAVFAVFAALAVGFSVLGIFLSNNDEVMQAFVTIVNSTIPGLLGEGDDAVVSTDELLSQRIAGITGAIALIGLLWTAISWLYYTRQAIRTVFRLPRDTRPFIRQKLSDLLLAFAFGVVMIVSALVSAAGTQIVERTLEFTGLESSSIWTRITTGLLSVAISVALNFIVLATMYRVLAKIPIPFRLLAEGAAISSAGIAVLSYFAGLIVGGASNNPLLGVFAAFAGLMLWLNMVSRVILIGSAWIAVRVADKGLADRMLTDEDRAAELARAVFVLARENLNQAIESERNASWWSKRRAKRLTDQRRAELDRAQAAVNDTKPGTATTLGP